MKSLMKKNLVMALLTLVCCMAYGQSTKRVSATYIYYPPENVSIEEAKVIALERAKIQAIADKFGTIISQTNVTRLESIDGEAATDFTSLGESFVKGEWIETIGNPEIVVDYDKVAGMLAVKCTVKGRAREIASAQTKFSAKLLADGGVERDEFKDGEKIYLSFSAPTNGYLAVYLVDTEKKANCLLPYPSDSDGQMAVKHGQEYLFFSSEKAPKDDITMVTEEYIMSCADRLEINQVYVIFSPTPFTKAVDKSGGPDIPRYLSVDDFYKWLADCRKLDPKMGVEVKTIHVKKR